MPHVTQEEASWSDAVSATPSGSPRMQGSGRSPEVLLAESLVINHSPGQTSVPLLQTDQGHGNVAAKI